MITTLPMKKVFKAMQKRLPFVSEAKMNERLELFCESLAEAYKVGAEEAKHELLRRICDIDQHQQTAKKDKP